MFRLNTFGGLSLDDGSGLGLGRAGQRRRLALLATLAAARGSPVSRDKLIGWFWPEHDTAAARHALAQAVYAIRRSMGEAAVLGGAADDLRLNTEVVASDVAAFVAAIERGDPEAAVGVYAGPFLDGFYVGRAPGFEAWVETERDRLARLYGQALEDLARGAAATGEPVRALAWWTRLAAHAPLDARVVMETMRAGVTAGDRTGALRQAARHSAACRAMIESDPDPGVQALAQQIRLLPPPTISERGPNGGAAPERRRRARRARLPVAVLATGLVVAVGLLLSRQLRPASPPDRQVVLGSVESSDPTLGLAIREVLRAELEDTPGLRVMTDPALRETLRLMHLEPDSPVVDAVAVELAQRRGAPVAVVGTAEPLGVGISVVVRVLDGRSGRRVATITARPADRGHVVAEMTRLARSVRERVSGFKPAPGTPLPSVTTASLPALKSYALARRELGQGDRAKAVELTQAALVYDSTFALAHYLLGDQLWFMDRNRASQFHLRRAFELSARLPPRERLIVQARYEQLVLDQPDSSAATWERLRTAYPDEVNAYEGLAWSYRALGRFADAAWASGAALALDPEARLPNINARLFALLAQGDTAAAAAFARDQQATLPWGPSEVALFSALLRGDNAAAEAVLRAAYPLAASGAVLPEGATRWQIGHLVEGQLADAERAMGTAVRAGRAQEPPRALLLQARAELGLGGTAEHAVALAREALEWTRDRDLSAPAYARLLERVGDIAAYAGDHALLDSTEMMLRRLDEGRNLRSFRLAREAVAAQRAYARGAYAEAARRAARARAETYFWRSASLLALLEANAMAAAGDTAAAGAGYAALLQWPVEGDADYETWLVVRSVVARLRWRPAGGAIRR